MSSKMLIDATHREETRVVVKRGNKVEEFDFEALAKKQLRGNIYLAKVTRVEPSLQAAFVDYGGNRHGFLAFSEIHPDYYQIPQADRDELLADERGHRDADEDDPTPETPDLVEGDQGDQSDQPADSAHSETEALGISRQDALTAGLFAGPMDGDTLAVDEDDDVIDESGADDALEEARPAKRPSRRHYKIQEVIKRRQIILVQVVKEERGNKGAALTTYLSLAGRYAVLMPNTPRGGGISRKITSASDRKRLKAVVSDLDVPDGMGVILRTAGANRTKVEIKRDFEYMMRLWETVRDLTLDSSAPALVYEEGSLIKRSIRDLYSRDIDEVLVEGDDGYREAKGFMRMLMPSHARNVKQYRDAVPLYTAQGVEEQLDNMYEPTVRLKSGGYLVINQTEALVAIDVNSGKSTREHNIEDTAVATNLEAADEIARQLRLRDLAGLVVCDFIDMEEKRNNRAVEKRMKDALKSDRARIQVGRISHFGLLEMSRQRIRTSLIESTMEPCPHCNGTGYTRSESSVALQILRQAEGQLLRTKGHHVGVTLRAQTALYIINHKRDMLADIEARYGRRVSFNVDDSIAADQFSVGRGAALTPEEKSILPEPADIVLPEDEDEPDEQELELDGAGESESESNGDGRKRKRRRRRRRSGRDDDMTARLEADEDSSNDDVALDDAADASEARADDEQGEREPRKRRRSRRGGRRRRGGRAQGDQEATETLDENAPSLATLPADIEDEGDGQVLANGVAEPVADADEADRDAVDTAPIEDPTPVDIVTEELVEKPGGEPPAEPVMESSNPDANGAPKKQGWWQRRSFF